MFPRFSVTLLSILIGCRQGSNWARAFGRDSLPRSHGISNTRLPAALEPTEPEEAETKASRDELMDESVLLYSIVSQRTKFGGHTEAELDVLNLRGKELTSLFEDAAFYSKGIVREGIASETPLPDTIVEEEKQPETVFELSQALDEQILFGYQSTFTEDELEEWIERINGLQQKLQSQLAALPPASSVAVPTEAKKPPTHLDRMHGRLDTLRTLIDPEGSSLLRLPLARPVISRKPKTQAIKKVLKPPVPTYSPPVIPINGAGEKNEIDNSEIKATAEDSMEEGVAIKSENKVAKLETQAIKKVLKSPVPTYSPPVIPINGAGEKNENDDLEIKATAEDSMQEEVAIKSESKVAVTKDDPAEHDSTIATTNENTVSPNIIQEQDKGQTMTIFDVIDANPIKNDETAPKVDDTKLEEAEIAASLEGESSTIVIDNEGILEEEPQTEASTTASMPHAAQQSQQPGDKPDVVSPLVATAAIGAAAVTANPLMFAGVALGPVIRDAIASAKLRTKNSKKKSPFKLNNKTKTKNSKKKSTFKLNNKTKNKIASKEENDKDGNGDNTDQNADASEATR